MAIRAYTASLATYNSWATLTEYTLTNRVVPMVYNGKCYECTTGGTSGETGPTWDDTLDSTTNDGTVVWTCREYESAPAAVSVELDTAGYGGLPLKEIWVKSDSADIEFIVYGSHDNVGWRQIDELTLPTQSESNNRHKGLQNAYRHIRVSTETVATSEIEIVAGE